MRFLINRIGIAVAAAVLLFSYGFAQDRPDENEMFGSQPDSGSAPKAGAAPKQQATVEKIPAAAASGENRDQQELQASNPDRDAFASGEAKENPLQIGGVYYQRMIFSNQEGLSASNSPLSFPLQVDGYLDARPNERIRAYIVPRLLYDPSLDSFSRSTSGTNPFGSLLSSSTSTAPSSLSGTTPTSIPNNPQVVLDQAWIKFDIEHTLFITAGKQHVKWGVGHFWNPTDFLNTQRRDPLLPYDLRLGNNMVRFGLPLEGSSTNFYAIALLDNPQPASTLGQVGGAFRAETVLWNAELGAEAVLRNGVNNSFGADISAPLGPLDVYAELAELAGANVPLYQMQGSLASGSFSSSTFQMAGPLVQAVAGLSYDFAWKENRQATLGAEYFYNELGYENPEIYPVLIFFGQYQPFYTGKHYVAVYLSAEGPDAEKHTSYNFSTLGNLSDGSFISRLDFSWRFLTYLTFESYADAHYGDDKGEFHFSFSIPQAVTFNGTSIPALNIPAPSFDLGMALRVAL